MRAISGVSCGNEFCGCNGAKAGAGAGAGDRTGAAAWCAGCRLLLASAVAITFHGRWQ